MKKLTAIFSLILLVGLGNVSAQDTTRFKQNNSTRRDTSNIDPNMRIPKDMSNDSAKRMGNRMPNDRMYSDTSRRMGGKMPMDSNNRMGDRMQNDRMNSDTSRRMGDRMQNDRMNSDTSRHMGDKMNKDRADRMSNDSSRYVGSKSPMGRNGGMMADLNSWPEASRMAAEEITAKYGNPDMSTEDALVWKDKGVWKKICVDKMETKHSFPIEHTDMMETTINYKVPIDKMDELGRFDGSVTFDRTRGTMSARCDKEANNFLALNLAHDIITNKKTVAQARLAYGDIVKQKMKGQNPLYMQKLTFTTQAKAADPDINTTGLTKEDVMKGVKKTDLKNNK